MDGGEGWGSLRVKGASHWPAPLCQDLLRFFQLYTSALWCTEFLWGQCSRQQLAGEGRGSPNNPSQVSAGAQCPVPHVLPPPPPPPPSCVSER